MEKAYVLIGCELGAENEIVGKLKKIDKVKDARVVYGDYDIVVEAETDTESQMDSLITKKDSPTIQGQVHYDFGRRKLIPRPADKINTPTTAIH